MPNSSPPLPQIVAHRGNAAEFPENTLPALRSALELGAPCVEFDVHLSADHVPIVLHDASLKRTAGLDRNALEMNWDELQGITVGESTRFGPRYQDVGIPTLAQVVQLLSGFPNATAFVELKRASLRTFGQEVVVHRVCEALKPIAAQAVLISFDLPCLEYARRNGGHRVGWVISEYSNASAIKAEASAPEYLFCDQQILPAGHARLWRGAWQWAVYEVRERELALSLAAREVKLIETMEVRSMLQALRTAGSA